jgi:lysophospholipase L1-like esterase
VEAAYQDLLDYVSVYSKNPKIKVITHTYDFVVPNAQGARFFRGIWDYDKGRSWMYPFMMNKGITETRDQREIARRMLAGFEQTIKSLAEQENYKNNFIVVTTQGTLTESDWLNEIHPNTRGFKLIEEKIYSAIKTALS